MSEYVFYYPDGTEIEDKEKFIEFYSKCYYMTANVVVEQEIEKLLYKTSGLSEKDIFKILAWKIGKINHKESTKEEFKYCKGWNEQDLEADIYGYLLKKEDFSTIKTGIAEMKNKNLKDCIGLLEHIPKIGFVYICTLRYFATNGEYPIYDRFADKSVTAIKEKKKFRESFLERHVSFEKINARYKEKDKGKMVEIYDKDYLEPLKKIFLDEYKNRKQDPETWRKVDQALWSYGHLF